jgi:membrane-associated phospholipid phosphatase
MRRLARAFGLAVGLLSWAAVAGAQAPVDEPGPIRRFVESIGRDLDSLSTKESVVLITAATAAALLITPFDEALTARASSSPFLKSAFDGWARRVGQEWVLGGGALATYVVGRRTGNARAARVGGDLMEAQLISGFSTLILKYAVNRERPDRYPRSFPSGHASGTFASAVVLDRHFGPKVSVPAYVLAILASGARLQANSHFATDVILGTTVGILAGRAATFDFGPATIAMSPAAVPGGAAVMFHVVP